MWTYDLLWCFICTINFCGISHGICMMMTRTYYFSDGSLSLSCRVVWGMVVVGEGVAELGPAVESYWSHYPFVIWDTAQKRNSRENMKTNTYKNWKLRSSRQKNTNQKLIETKQIRKEKHFFRRKCPPLPRAIFILKIGYTTYFFVFVVVCFTVTNKLIIFNVSQKKESKTIFCFYIVVF